MALLDENCEFDIFSEHANIYSNANIFPPHYVGDKAVVQNSLVCNGCTVLGEVRNSILSTEAYVGPGAKVEDSILLPGARVESGARVMRAIVGERAVVEVNAYFGSQDKAQPIAVVGDNEHVADDLWSGRY